MEQSHLNELIEEGEKCKVKRLAKKIIMYLKPLGFELFSSPDWNDILFLCSLCVRAEKKITCKAGNGF